MSILQSLHGAFSLIKERLRLSGWSDLLSPRMPVLLTGRGDSTWLGWLSLVFTCAAYDDKDEKAAWLRWFPSILTWHCCVFVFISLIIGEAMSLAFNISFVMLCQRLG